MLSYNTNKEVIVKSFTLRLLKLSIQLVVALYLAWVFYYQKGYQNQEIGYGFTQVRANGNSLSVYGNETIVWDTIDTVVPAKEREALFLVSNYEITKKPISFYLYRR